MCFSRSPGALAVNPLADAVIWAALWKIKGKSIRFVIEVVKKLEFIDHTVGDCVLCKIHERAYVDEAAGRSASEGL